jgi:uncharacterized protein
MRMGNVPSINDGIVREQVRIPVMHGSLAGELAYHSSQRPRFAAVLVNPHPHMGGSMQNNLIAALATGLAAAGGATLRFDYRGVGQSDGTHLDLTRSLAEFWQSGHAPEDPLMIDDARAAMEWMRGTVHAPTIVVGYSFGCYAAVHALRASPDALILISPTISQHDLTRLAEFSPRTLVLHSDNDFATPADATRSWVSQFDFPIVSICYSGAEHFFRGRENGVIADCTRFVDSAMATMEVA